MDARALQQHPEDYAPLRRSTLRPESPPPATDPFINDGVSL